MAVRDGSGFFAPFAGARNARDLYGTRRRRPIERIDIDVELRDAIDAAEEVLVRVDCSGVTFMDSAGYRVLVSATDYAARRGHTLVLRDMSPSCAMLIRLCDSSHELLIERSTPALTSMLTV